MAKTAKKAAPAKTVKKAAPKAEKEVKKAAPAKAAAPAKKPAAKAAAKPATKQAQKPATKQAQKPVGANITAMVIEGIAKRIEAGSKFYARAIQYHKQAGTIFPRARNNETRAALKEEDVTEVFRQHDAHILASGNAKGQAMFDVYMMSKG